MFTGLIQSVGVIRGTRRIPGGFLLNIRHGFPSAPEKGASVAVNGVCLTVTEDRQGIFSAECYWETAQKTNLDRLKPGMNVNLEQSLRADGALDGHLVQGHVSSVVQVIRTLKRGRGLELTVSYPPEHSDALIPEGSVALDGVSLTIAGLGQGALSVQLIGETLEQTTLKERRPGDLVNMETDFLLRRHRLPGRSEKKKEQTITMGRLAEWGYV